ncbi:50S ribosomal protein L1 [Candidatus Uhrbacteria bacterium]|nr:50S ribosomal protein L1 [Candidatus Uhrbacteria bacterium]
MQRKKTKTFKVKKGGIEKSKRYSIEDALQLVLESSYEKFDPSLELHIRTGIDPRKGDQIVRGSVVLPHASGKTKKIAVFAEGDKAKEALGAGVDIVGGQEMIEQIKQTGKADFDIAIATPDMMKSLASVARILGPRGLMPSPKNNTVTANVRSAIEEVKKGRLDFKNDTGGTVHITIGKKSLGNEKLLANYSACMEALRKVRPSTVKGAYIRTISLSSTMGPGIFVQP